MELNREVILDLLPVYLSGEASPSTRAVVEEFFKQDPELAQRVRLQWAEGLNRVASSGLSPELELRSLKRTRGVLRLQRWLFGFALAFSAFGLSFEISLRHGRLLESHFLFLDFPAIFGTSLAFGAVCWIIYSFFRHRLRHAGF